MFLLRDNAYQIFNEYLEFRLCIQFFKEDCLEDHTWWPNRVSYEKSLKQLEHAYNNFMQLHGELVDKNVEDFIRHAEVIIYSKKFTRQSTKHLYRLAHQLEIECDDKLFSKFFRKRALMLSGKTFSIDLIRNIAVSIDTKNFDSAVVEAFKTFEEKLTSLLETSPTKYSGENLANYAFGSKTGKIQLETKEAEQLGLRNLYSGAYSLFRNPSAHRSVGNSEISTNTIVALLSLILKIAEDNYQTEESL